MLNSINFMYIYAFTFPFDSYIGAFKILEIF